jgi:hypothetical protein
MVVGALVLSAANAVNLIAIGSTGMLIWAIALCIGAPLVSLVQAMRLARSESKSGPIRLRGSSLIVSGVLLAQFSMWPLAENLREASELQEQCAAQVEAART